MSGERSADERTPRDEGPPASFNAPAPVAWRPGQGGTSESAYIITGVGLGLTAIVLVLLWLKFFRRRTMQRLLAEAEERRLQRELQERQRQSMLEDHWDDDGLCTSAAQPRKPLTIKEAVVIWQPDGTTDFAYSEKDEESEDDDAALDGTGALRTKKRRVASESDDGDTESIPAVAGQQMELSTVVVVGEPRRAQSPSGDQQSTSGGDADSASTSSCSHGDTHTSEPVVARENTFEWVGTGTPLPPPPHLVFEPDPPPPPPRPRRWYHRMLGLRQEEPPAAETGGRGSNARPVMTSTVLGAHDTGTHPMALAFSFGG